MPWLKITYTLVPSLFFKLMSSPNDKLHKSFCSVICKNDETTVTHVNKHSKLNTKMIYKKLKTNSSTHSIDIFQLHVLNKTNF